MALRHPGAAAPLTFGLLLVAVTHGRAFSETRIPASVPAEPTLEVNKDPGTGDVVLSWTATASPYATVRSANPDFFGSVSPSIIASGVLGTSYRDPVLTDGVNYFYSIEDVNTATRVYAMSTTSALAGDSVTLIGLGFDTSSPGANEVFLTGSQAVVTAVTDTTLTFVVPTDTVTGSVVASSANGADGGRTLYVVATSGLTNISSLAVDEAHVLFVSDTGSAATSDKVFKVDPATGLRTQVGALNEATGLPADFATPNRLYYGNALVNSYNYGTIERTDSTGNEVFYRTCGNSATADLCHVFAIGLDPYLTDFGAEGRLYVADGAVGKQKVRIVPQYGIVTDFATGFDFGTPPRGIVVDLNVESQFFHDVFVADATKVRQYSDSVPGVLQKTYDSSNSPIVAPGQMAITAETTGPPQTERLLVADRGQNRVVMINLATDKTKTIDVPLSTPRGIALDQDSNNKIFAYVAEPTRVLKFPVYKTVFVAPWIASGSEIGPQRVRNQIDRANRALEPCGIELKIRNDAVNYFEAGANLDLNITDWTNPANSCTNPALVHTAQEQAILTGQRSAEPTDLNIYFVRSFTGPAGGQTIAETLTADCFSDVTDTTNSGIIVSFQLLNQYTSDTIRTIGHEIGHALLDRLSWASGDEHKDQAGVLYSAPNIMTLTGQRARRGFEDPDQCANINQDSASQIFRGDP